MCMTIKEVSEKFKISQDTLRYYERVGLIPPVSRTASGIRNYQESDLGWVEHAGCILQLYEVHAIIHTYRKRRQSA